MFLSVSFPWDCELPEGLPYGFPLVSASVPAKSFVYRECSINRPQIKLNLVLKSSWVCFVVCALRLTLIMELVLLLWIPGSSQEKRTRLGWRRWWCPKWNLSFPATCLLLLEAPVSVNVPQSTVHMRHWASVFLPPPFLSSNSHSAAMCWGPHLLSLFPSATPLLYSTTLGQAALSFCSNAWHHLFTAPCFQPAPPFHFITSSTWQLELLFQSQIWPSLCLKPCKGSVYQSWSLKRDIHKRDNGCWSSWPSEEGTRTSMSLYFALYLFGSYISSHAS